MFDIFFISYNEPNADENFKRLIQRFPKAKRIHGVTGIHQAHIAAAKQTTGRMFWVVDGDAELVDSFNFDYYVPHSEADAVHVWRSRNPINGLEYGYGGVKLLPRRLTLNMDVSTTDMTMNISSKFISMPEVSNITAFNTDPFSTWRSAFRESCKLSLNTDQDSINRLTVWCTVATGNYAKDAIAGALAGKKYGQENAPNKEALNKINDFSWLQDQWSLEKSQQ